MKNGNIRNWISKIGCIGLEEITIARRFAEDQGEFTRDELITHMKSKGKARYSHNNTRKANSLLFILEQAGRIEKIGNKWKAK